jgi:superfamily II RNA helicase
VSSSLRERFVRAHGFALDTFQVEALDLLDAKRSVLVVAPTGSGKTLVAEYAVAQALEAGQRAIYTTPLKALSNQKYGDLVSTYGPERVGLLTGDVSLRADADVVVMTTEVLRNMIYAQASGLSRLACVILDEVHYLEDRYRGAVWEEIILSAPPQVVLVCLSATVSNPQELAGWIHKVRGDTGVVIERHRPVELENLFVVRDPTTSQIKLLPTFVGNRPNPRALAADARARRVARLRPAHAGTSRKEGRDRSFRPTRPEVIERFAAEDLLPAIYFVFSRAGCDDAVRQCLDAGVHLTTPAQQQQIRSIARAHIEDLDEADLLALGHGRFLSALEAGIASHHAGLVPPFRETVEELFARALVKVVFATETLALGINMPARSVVIESLSKFSGAGHVDLTAGEYQQLTGRAGRRGIDPVGYGAVVWSPFHTFEEVALLAGAPSAPLRSSFRPTYNMAVNLVRRYDRSGAYRLVRSSFAQYLSKAPLTRQLDAVLELLSARGYLRGWRLTRAGTRLAGIYHDCDLLVAESISAGLLADLDPASLASLVSAFTYEPRQVGAGTGPPSAKLARRYDKLDELASELRRAELDLRIPPTRLLDPGFMGLAYAWACGETLSGLLEPPPAPARRKRSGARRGATRASTPSNAPMSGGDFVRNMKQLVDLLSQIAAVEHPSPLARSAASAADALVRGVVAASSGVPGVRLRGAEIHEAGPAVP